MFCETVTNVSRWKPYAQMADREKSKEHNKRNKKLESAGDYCFELCINQENQPIIDLKRKTICLICFTYNSVGFKINKRQKVIFNIFEKVKHLLNLNKKEYFFFCVRFYPILFYNYVVSQRPVYDCYSIYSWKTFH